MPGHCQQHTLAEQLHFFYHKVGTPFSNRLVPVKCSNCASLTIIACVCWGGRSQFTNKNPCMQIISSRIYSFVLLNMKERYLFLLCLGLGLQRVDLITMRYFQYMELTEIIDNTFTWQGEKVRQNLTKHVIMEYTQG